MQTVSDINLKSVWVSFVNEVQVDSISNTSKAWKIDPVKHR